MELLCDAVGFRGTASLPLIANTCDAILHLGQMEAPFWAFLTKDSTFRVLVRKLVLLDPRRPVRMAALELFESFVATGAPPSKKASQGESASAKSTEWLGLARYLWPIVSELVPETLELPDQCHELFRLLEELIVRLRGQVNLAELASPTSRLLLRHQTNEVGALFSVAVAPWWQILTRKLQSLADQDPCDPVARGLSSVLKQCLSADDTLVGSDVLPT